MRSISQIRTVAQSDSGSSWTLPRALYGRNGIHGMSCMTIFPRTALHVLWKYCFYSSPSGSASPYPRSLGVFVRKLSWKKRCFNSGDFLFSSVSECLYYCTQKHTQMWADFQHPLKNSKSKKRATLTNNDIIC